MPRDRIDEVVLIKERAGKYQRLPSKHDFEHLQDLWQTTLKGTSPIDELVPVRVVTMLEVFFRYWIEALIDHGNPYMKRASDLKIDLKFDYAIAASVKGGIVSLGQLVAHSVSLSRLETIAATFQALLGEDFFGVLSRTTDHLERKQKGEATPPIIGDIAKIRTSVARLFEVRHIVTHELPQHRPYDDEALLGFINAAAELVEAAEEEFTTRLFGDYPVSQAAITEDAGLRYQAAAAELDVLCKQVASKTPEISEVQDFWLKYMEAEAERQAQRKLGGSIRPMIYSLAAETLTRSRIDELKNWLENRMD